VVVYGVEGEDFAAGAGLSTAVESAVEAVAEAIVQDLGGNGA
jgi:hypothetical protein